MPPVEESTTDETSAMTPEETAAMEAAFASSFEASTDTVPPTTPELAEQPATTQEPATEDAAETPEQAQPEPELATVTKAQLDDLLAKAHEVETLKATIEQRFGTAFGKLGGFERSLREIQAATPAGQNLTLSEDDFSEMKEEFPELLGLTLKGLNRALGKVKGTGLNAADLEVKVNERVSERLSSELPKVKQEMAMDVMTGLREDWEAVVHSKPYLDWLTSQPEDYRSKIENTWKPSEVLGSIKKFEQSQQPAPTPKPTTPPRSSRMAAAVAPKGSGSTSPSGATDLDAAFSEGFRTQRV